MYGPGREPVIVTNVRYVSNTVQFILLSSETEISDKRNKPRKRGVLIYAQIAILGYIHRMLVKIVLVSFQQTYKQCFRKIDTSFENFLNVKRCQILKFHSEGVDFTLLEITFFKE